MCKENIIGSGLREFCTDVHTNWQGCKLDIPHQLERSATHIG